MTTMAKQNPLLEKGRAIVSALKDRMGGGEQPEAGGERNVFTTTAAFMRNNVAPVMARWIPALRDTQDDVRASWTLATARATDIVQNSGWISGALNAAVGNVIGSGLRLVCKPDTTLVKFDGLTDDSGQPIDSEGWARFVERRWEAWSNNPRECDALARQTVNQLARSAFLTWFVTGEIVGTLPFHLDHTAMSGTKVLLLPPWKLAQTNNTLERIVQGVQMDARGRPWAYIFKVRDQLGVERDTPVLAYDGVGRPQVFHLYEGLPGQIRGITPLISILQVVKQYDQLANATLSAALIQSLFAATMESEAPTSDVMRALEPEDSQGVGGGTMEDYLAARMGWNQNTTIDLNEQSRVAHLFPGEKLKFNRSEHPNTTYEAFVKVLLREIAKGVGTTTGQVTGDYVGASYTGVRMENTDVWQITKNRRDNLMARFYQMIYEAWLEEEIESGRIKFPGGIEAFFALRSSASRAEWRGPPKPQADDLKTAKTHQVYREMGIMSDTVIADDLGMRIEDQYEARKREADMRKKWGLKDLGPSVQITSAEIANDPDNQDREAA